MVLKFEILDALLSEHLREPQKFLLLAVGPAWVSVFWLISL